MSLWVNSCTWDLGPLVGTCRIGVSFMDLSHPCTLAAIAHGVAGIKDSLAIELAMSLACCSRPLLTFSFASVTVPADAAWVPGCSVWQPHVVPPGRRRGVWLHQPPPRLEAPSGQRLHHALPLHYHEGRCSDGRLWKSAGVFATVGDVATFVTVLDVGCGHHHACPMWCLHASVFNRWAEFTVFLKPAFLLQHPDNPRNHLVSPCVTVRSSIWQASWRNYGNHVSWWHTCWWQRLSHSSRRLCCSG